MQNPAIKLDSTTFVSPFLAAFNSQHSCVMYFLRDTHLELKRSVLWSAHLHARKCDDTGMNRTARSANPTYREREESTRIDQVMDPIACDSETRFDTCLGLKRPE